MINAFEIQVSFLSYSFGTRNILNILSKKINFYKQKFKIVGHNSKFSHNTVKNIEVSDLTHL